MTFRTKWDERQRAVWNRAWRRTCLLILAAVWVNAIFGPWVGPWREAFFALYGALLVMQVQAVWGGAYFGPGEETRLTYVMQGVASVGFTGYYIWQVIKTGDWFGADSGIYLVLMLMFLPIGGTAGARWLFDRHKARSQWGASAQRLAMGALYDERQVVIRNRAWRRTCWFVLVLLVANAIWGPWGTDETWPMLLTWFALAAQLAQGIWERAYFRDAGDQRTGAFALGGLAGLCAWTFVQYGISTGQWWGAGNPTRAVSCALTLVVLAVLGLRWWLDRQDIWLE